MPRLTRRFATRALLATGGTVLGAVAARKLADSQAGAVAYPETPPLQDIRSLRPAPPRPFPPWSWHRVEPGGTVRRSIADHSGHPVVLNLWATWCPPCTREMPSLAALARSASGVDVLPVSIDRGGAAPVRAFFAGHGIDGLPVLIDPGGSAMAALGLTGLPTTFLVDARGLVRARFEGAADWSSPATSAALRRVFGRTLP